jgi:hypothetical protein
VERQQGTGVPVRPVFRLATPGNWFDLDLDPATRDRSIAALVDRRAEGSPEIAARRLELKRLLRRAARESAEGGVVLASMMSEAFEGRAMSASVTLTLRSATTAAGGGPPVTDVADIAAFFRRSAQAPGRETAVDVVRLPPGEAVRLQGRRETQVPGLVERAEGLMVQFLLPIRGTAALAILTFTTTALELAEPFAELFDTMAATLVIDWEAEA